MTQPPPERKTISRRQHYFDLTIVCCMLLIVLAQMPWPRDTLRRAGIDVTGVVLSVLAGNSVPARTAGAGPRAVRHPVTARWANRFDAGQRPGHTWSGRLRPGRG